MYTDVGQSDFTAAVSTEDSSVKAETQTESTDVLVEQQIVDDKVKYFSILNYI
jgi:hypothetical protein